MKITYNWLKDFVDISLKPEALAEKLTMAGLEVTALEKFEDDYVFEIEVTSNRPDWLSVAGIAREAAAITKSKIKKSLPAGRQEKSKSQFKIQNLKKETTQFKINITDKNACPFYSARIIRNVKVKPSPSWLVKRIQAIGLRPIHNIVDIQIILLAFVFPTLANSLSSWAVLRIKFENYAIARRNLGVRSKNIS